MAYRPSNSRTGKVKTLPSVGAAARGGRVYEREERAHKGLADAAAARLRVRVVDVAPDGLAALEVAS